MLPALAIGGGLLQGALGFFGAKKKAAQLAEQEKQNRAANVMNQAWSGMLGNKPMLQESFEKPSALGGALQGGLAGAMQGMNVYQGLQDMKAKELMLDKLRGQALVDNAQPMGGQMGVLDKRFIPGSNFTMNG
jgi:hypothetical protein